MATSSNAGELHVLIIDDDADHSELTKNAVRSALRETYPTSG
ncbi:MAG: hypothetical protein AAFX79_08380 [Planctomycetota bacterium]